MIPKCGADLRKYDVTFRHAPGRGKLRRYAESRIMHGGRANKVDDVGAAFAHVSALDQVTERALRQPDRKSVAQSRHAAIAEPSADPQPIDFFLRFHASQPHIRAVEVGDFTEARRERRVLSETKRSNDADAIFARAAFFQRRNGGA